jgi:hypothetical protein
MSRLDHRAAIARAEVRVVDRGDFAVRASQFVRSDPTLHHSLGYVQQQPWVAPKPPPEPTERDVRAQLTEALAAQVAADEAAQQSVTLHRRAEDYRGKAQKRLAEYASLDSEIAAATMTALRDGIDPSTAREQFGARIAERATALAAAQGAETAAATLLHEMTLASQRTTDAARAVDALAVRVLAFAATRLAEEWRAHQAEMDRRRTALLGFDRVATPHRVYASLPVRIALGSVDTYETGRADFEVWQRAVEALRADPQAEVEIALPPSQKRPLPVPVVYSRTEHPALPGPPEAPPDGVQDQPGLGQPAALEAVPEAAQRPPGPQDDGDPSLVTEESA